ncbi:MAG: undecaprenyldiphospho-muramoylpentapeptide beta-N-acetylglucosaminyltransferase [Candidatus Omnitrophota bacterium]
MTILITTGGSGGHIYPALTVARSLRERGHKVFFAGVFKQWKNDIEEEGFSLFELPAKGWQSNSLKDFIVSARSMLKSIKFASEILKDSAPERVLGFGGYGSFPIVLMAAVRRIPVVIHEQNVIPGRANRLLSGFARRILVSFPESVRYFPSSKVIETGYPVRPFLGCLDQEEIFKEFGFSKLLTIAVVGGSQGSRSLNHIVLQAMALLKDLFDFQVIHLTGKTDEDIIRMGYQRLGIRHQVFPFLKMMEKVYLIADVIISRAGAGALHEIAHFNIPAVIVPYPYAGGHQKYNAAAFLKNGRGIMIEEKNLSPKRLCAEINQLGRKTLPAGTGENTPKRNPVDEIIKALIEDTK